MNDADTTPTTPERPEPIDWSRFDAMSAEARHRAALDDPDAQPRHPRRRPLKRNGHGGRTKQSKSSGGGTPNGGRSCRRISRPWNANWRSGPVIGSGWRGTSPHRQRGWADKWGELARAQRVATAAAQALDALEAAYADWRQVHKLGLLLLAGLPGSRRREVPAWEQRIAAARATLEQAQGALAVAQEAYNARLPAAEREARQMAEDGRRQLAALQGRIEERAGLIQRAKAAQEAERERLNAEARTRAEAERQQREVEQRKTQESDRPLAEPPAPKQEPPKFAISAPRPKPRYPAPGG